MKKLLPLLIVSLLAFTACSKPVVQAPDVTADIEYSTLAVGKTYSGTGNSAVKIKDLPLDSIITIESKDGAAIISATLLGQFDAVSATQTAITNEPFTGKQSFFNPLWAAGGVIAGPPLPVESEPDSESVNSETETAVSSETAILFERNSASDVSISAISVSGIADSEVELTVANMPTESEVPVASETTDVPTTLEHLAIVEEIQIEATGDWTITITPMSEFKLPASFHGNGTAVFVLAENQKVVLTTEDKDIKFTAVSRGEPKYPEKVNNAYLLDGKDYKAVQFTATEWKATSK